MMNQEKTAYLNLLRCFVWDSEPEPLPDDLNWDVLLNLSSIHSDMGILGYMLMKHPALAPGAVPSMWKKCLQTISLSARRAERMNELIKQLDVNGIEHLLLKGFVIRDIYCVPELRTFGDVDFLIRLEDRIKCDDLMMSNGFERGTDWEPVFSYKKGIEYYEIHTDIMEVDVSDQADYKGYFKKIWEHAYLRDGHTWLPEKEFHLLYLLTHIAKHISGAGAGIRMYLDIALYIKEYRGEIDWKHFCGELEVLKFEKFVNIVFTAVERWFGVESPIPLSPINEEIMTDFLDFTLDGGVFGFIGLDLGVNDLKKELRGGQTPDKGKTLRNRMFPSAASIESRYTYLQGRHWLLPAAWIHRFLRTREKWGQHMAEAKSILNADEEKALRLKRVQKEIGL